MHHVNSVHHNQPVGPASVYALLESICFRMVDIVHDRRIQSAARHCAESVHCFERSDGGKLTHVMVIDPVSAESLECR